MPNSGAWAGLSAIKLYAGIATQPNIFLVRVRTHGNSMMARRLQETGLWP